MATKLHEISSMIVKIELKTIGNNSPHWFITLEDRNKDRSVMALSLSEFNKIAGKGMNNLYQHWQYLTQ